jgi:hypothetical protein
LKANKIGKQPFPCHFLFTLKNINITGKNNEDHPLICECCLKNSNKTDFDTNTDPKEFANINLGFSLFFKMLDLMKIVVWKLGFVLLGFTFLDYLKCKFFSRKTLIDSDNPLLLFWELLGHSIKGIFKYLVDCCFFLSSIFFVYWLRHSMNNYYQNLREEGPPLISDFSLFIQDLPRDKSLIDLKLDLQAFFRSLNHNNGLSYSLVNCSFCLYCEDYLNLQRRLQLLKNTIFNLEEELATSSENSDSLISIWNSKTEELEIVNKELSSLQHEFYEILVQGKHSSRFTGNAFFTFECKHSVDDLIDRYSSQRSQFIRMYIWLKHFFLRVFFKLKKEPVNSKNSLLNRKQEYFLSNERLYRFSQTKPKTDMEFKGKSLRVFSSVHPSNVNWDYFGVSQIKKILIRCVMTSLAWFILFLGFLIVLKFYFYRKQLQFNFPKGSLKQFFLLKMLSLMVSVVVCIINQVIVFFTRLTSHFEYHKKKTQRMVQELRKMLFRMFFNASVCTFIISFDIKLSNKNSISFDPEFFNPVNTFLQIYENFQIDQHFLLVQATTLFIVSCALFPLLVIFDPYYLLKVYTISRIKYEQKIDIDQKALNKIFQLPQFDLTSNSTSVIYILFTASLYIPFFPILSLIALNIFFYFQGFLLKKYFVRR